MEDVAGNRSLGDTKHRHTKVVSDFRVEQLEGWKECAIHLCVTLARWRSLGSQTVNGLFKVIQTLKRLIDRRKPKVCHLIEFPQRLQNGEANFVGVDL